MEMHLVPLAPYRAPMEANIIGIWSILKKMNKHLFQQGRRSAHGNWFKPETEQVKQVVHIRCQCQNV